MRPSSGAAFLRAGFSGLRPGPGGQRRLPAERLLRGLLQSPGRQVRPRHVTNENELNLNMRSPPRVPVGSCMMYLRPSFLPLVARGHLNANSFPFSWLAFECQDFTGRMYVLEAGSYPDLRAMGCSQGAASILSMQTIGFVRLPLFR